MTATADSQPIANTALPLRAHTLLGMCEGIGEDFGFNPILLRVPLAAIVLWDIRIAIGIYLALGLLVMATRLVFPNRRIAGAGDAAASTRVDGIDERLPLAA